MVRDDQDMQYVHYSVMLPEVIELLGENAASGLLFDCTLGEGGHSEALLRRFPAMRIVGIDRDSVIQQKASHRLAPYMMGDEPRFTVVNAWFDDFLESYEASNQESPQAILFDFGISTFHFDESGRGFSFSRNEPLDMRLDNHADKTALDIIQTYSREQLADVIFTYGEERYSRRIADAICSAREERSLRTSDDLADVIRGCVPKDYRYGRIHPATRTFQALRIEVNSELARIHRAIETAVRLLPEGGRVGAISFHSLEDRIVKQAFRRLSDGCVCPPEAMRCTCNGKPAIKILTKRPVRPSEEEVSVNPPSRSAKFRVAEKVGDDLNEVVERG